MSQQKILVTYGDLYGPEVIGAAERIIGTVAPDVEICYGRIGADAYNNTSYALPSDTMDLISECDAMLSGPIDMTGIPERNPLTTVKKQMGLFMEYGEYFPLNASMGNEDVNLIIMSPSSENTLNVFEMESLDGVASEYYTSVESTSKVFTLAVYVAEVKGRKEVCLVSDNVLYPVREKLIRDNFHKHFAATELGAKDSNTTEILFSLAHNPSSVSTLICDIHSATCVRGLASGLIGGSGLMPHAYLGERMGLYTSSPVIANDTPGRERNPTSAILSAAVMLQNMGREEDHDLILEAVHHMYQNGRTTPDVGGKLNAKNFTQGIREYILSKLHS